MNARAVIRNELYQVHVLGTKEALWTYELISSEESYFMQPPSFEIDGKVYQAAVTEITESEKPRHLGNGSWEYRYRGVFVEDARLSLEMIFRIAPGNPVVRFAYQVHAQTERLLTKIDRRDNILYSSVDLGNYDRFDEVRFSDFNELTHHYCMTETSLDQKHFDNGMIFAGPMIVASNDKFAALMAYEHGSQSTDLYAAFQADRSKTLSLRAVKGSYCQGDRIHGDKGYRTLWLQFGAVQGAAEDLARAYRGFVLRHFSEKSSSRKPYIFYNTWNFQERNRYWNFNKYLDSMHLDHLLKEIDVAYRMGIEVYVIDTGWFVKTGDWEVNLERFPDGLAKVKERLDRYGMKLGLWFDPKAAALSSRAYQEYAHCVVSWNGEREQPHPIWETEESVRMCLVSPYGQSFADKLIELSKKLGVVYFKWDAIGQYGCNDPDHDHGGIDATPEERGNRFSFELCLKLVEIANKITEAIPEAIIDFDVTEGYRCVGLSFLEAGKYFLINNGPYFPNFDLPRSDPGEFYNYNVFFYPGPARSMLCRNSLGYDKWLPSILFLCHYFPDDPAQNQNISAASLILGHNGIWGDLLSVSEEGVGRLAFLLGLYKQVREDITSSYPVIYGEAGRNPEIYEKINEANGRGAVVLFANSFGKPFDKAHPVKHTYITEHAVDPNVWHPPHVDLTFDSSGRAVIEAIFHDADAAIVFFGVEREARFC